MSYIHDVTDSNTSVLKPGDDYYASDARRCLNGEDGVGRTIVGIGPSEPTLVLVGSRDELIRVFRDALSKLGA
ncbi:hypothetical protein [Mycolicibacterium sp.]|jgi:hypothetical protein|uniref:hypothetical protein n=1 Tax=Mycolicibacterium sp. TaxID=2320850 RepID=UPI00355E2530